MKKVAILTKKEIVICWFGEGKILLTLHISLFSFYIVHRQDGVGDDEEGGSGGWKKGKRSKALLKEHKSAKRPQHILT